MSKNVCLLVMIGVECRMEHNVRVWGETRLDGAFPVLKESVCDTIRTNH